jgi:hypothetical protein
MRRKLLKLHGLVATCLAIPAKVALNRRGISFRREPFSSGFAFPKVGAWVLPFKGWRAADSLPGNSSDIKRSRRTLLHLGQRLLRRRRDEIAGFRRVLGHFPTPPSLRDSL